jgi:uncharacterized membrane protein YkvA (DUF1232 family)
MFVRSSSGRIGFEMSDIEGTAGLPAAIARNEKTVRREFWPKLLRVLAHIPFATDLVAAWYCAFDPATPLKVKGILLAALAYFVLPLDTFPDFILGLGFTDDLTVLITAVGLIRNHLKREHYERAERAIERLRRGGASSAAAGS